MRGTDKRVGELFSYVDLETRVGRAHPLRPIREIANAALSTLSGEFATLYARMGRPSIAPEMLLRAMLLQAFYSVRSERQLMERLEFDLLFRWFVGLGVDDPVVSPTFVLVRRYRGLLPMTHADIYRIGSTSEIEDLDLPAEASDGVLVVEWGDAAEQAFGEDHLLVRFLVEDDGARTLELVPHGSWTRRPLHEVTT